MSNGFLYLASPYSHPELEVRQRRYEMARDMCSRLIRLGIHVFSPIVHTHDMAQANEMATDHVPWITLNHTMIERSSGIIVLQMEGWKQSKGVAEEIEYANKLGKTRLDIAWTE